jgi:hypothetical protein
MHFLNRGLSLGDEGTCAAARRGAARTAHAAPDRAHRPALPVVLAPPHERVTRRQAAGLLGAAGATVLLTLG